MITDDQLHDCEFKCADLEEMREHHGTPDRFAISVMAAVPAFVSTVEAFAAIGEYRRDYERMPSQQKRLDR